MLVDKINALVAAIGADIKALWLAVNGKMPRRGLYVNQGNVAAKHYYLIARINANNGAVRVKGLIGGHDLAAQGAASVDLSINSRSGTVPIYGWVCGSLGVQDLQVYRAANNDVYIYAVTGSYGSVDLEYSETTGATVYFSPVYETDTPAHTLIFSAAAIAPGIGQVRAVGRARFQPSVSGQAGINIAPGAPVTTPQDGDVWVAGDGLFYRAGGATRQVPLVGAGGVPTWTTATRPTVSEITIGFNTEKGNLEYWNGTEWLDLIDSGMYSLPFGEAMFGDDEASFTGFHD